MQESIVFLLRVQCRRRESSRSLSHLLMNFLYSYTNICFDVAFWLLMACLILALSCRIVSLAMAMVTAASAD